MRLVRTTIRHTTGENGHNTLNTVITHTTGEYGHYTMYTIKRKYDHYIQQGNSAVTHATEENNNKTYNLGKKPFTLLKENGHYTYNN